MGHTWLPTQAVTMKSFVLSSLFACGLAAPTTHVNSGVPVGPLTPAFGDAVQTPKGLRSLALEGFSEDLNQDGFVDPIGQAVVAAPVTYTVPQVYTHSVPQVYTHAVPQVYTHAVSSVGVPASTELLTKTVVAAPAIQYVSAPYAPLTPFVGGIPVAAPAAPAAPAAAEPAGVEVA